MFSRNQDISKFPLMWQDYERQGIEVRTLISTIGVRDAYLLGTGIWDAHLSGLELASSNLYHLSEVYTWVFSRKNKDLCYYF